MRRKRLYIQALLYFLFLTQSLFSQRSCGSDSYQEQKINRFPEIEKRLEILNQYQSYVDLGEKYDQYITIPVVIHVIYKYPEQNIPDSEIAKQIEIINNDFSGSNTDLSQVPDNFKPYLAGNCKIRFQLEKVFRVKTNKEVFYQNIEDIKFTAFGGHDIGQYSSNRYLNIWTGNVMEKKGGDSLLGYGTFPSITPAMLDGVVINYNAFGAQGSNIRFKKGRTATHEIGHWLGLYHLWGKTHWSDDDCADDEVSDTPIQKKANIGCLSYPKICECEPNNELGEMYMNFMDYVDDSCMVMFSAKQKERMRANFIPGGPRYDIVKSNVFNFQNLKDWEQIKDVSGPIISGFNKEILSWTPVANAENYTISIKSLNDDKVVNFTTKKLSATIEGLNAETLYEVEIIANKKNKEQSVSNPILIKDEQLKQEIIFTSK